MSSPSRPATNLAKPDVLDGLFASWSDIDDLLATLSPADWATATSLPGWTVRDIVAHLVGTESMLQGASPRRRRTSTCRPSSTCATT